MASTAVAAQPLDRVGEVEVDAEPAGPDAAALVADLLGGARGDVARAPGCRRSGSCAPGSSRARPRGSRPAGAVVALVLGHPDPAVVAQRLAHQRQLRLVVAGDRDAGRVDLRVAGVGEAARPCGAPARSRWRCSPWRWSTGRRRCRSRRWPAPPRRPGRLLISPVTRSRTTMPRAWPSTTIRSSISCRVYIVDVAGRDLPLERLVGAEQQLLAGLAAGVEGARDLRAAEGAVVEQAAVLAGERHALGDALVDDVDADLGEPVDVRLAGAEVAALDRVVEQPVDAVAVVAVVLGGVDAALRGDRVRAARAVLVAEGLDVVAELGQGRRGGAAGQAGADDDDRDLALVGRVDQLGARSGAAPSALDRAAGGLGVGDRLADGEVEKRSHGQAHQSGRVTATGRRGSRR